jgi:hypothetical protein
MTEVLSQSDQSERLTNNLLQSPLMQGVAYNPEVPQNRRFSPQAIQKIARDINYRDPELTRWFLDTNTEAIHATQSGSLKSILTHGLIPQSEHYQLPYPVTSQSFQSLSEPRPNIHMVHWALAADTKKYAEQPRHPITPYNLDEAILDDEIVEKLGDAKNIYGTLLRNRHFTAVALKNYLRSPHADPQHVEMLYLNTPILLGINITDLDQSAINSVNSVTAGDTTYRGRIPTNAITSVFTPEKNIDSVAKLTNRPVIALERLRHMTDDLI